MGDKAEIRPLSWWLETDIRPAPVILTLIAGLLIMFVVPSWKGYFLGIAAVSTLTSIHLTIWRAAEMIVRGGVEISEKQKVRIVEMEAHRHRT